LKNLIVIGGGPAGMMAAGVAAGHGCRTLLFEKNRALGRKLRITGKGRCNLTNIAGPEEFLENVPGNPKFLYTAAYKFGSRALVDFFQTLGVATKAERGGRVFPQSGNANQVADALAGWLARSGVALRLGEPVENLLAAEGRVVGVETRAGFFPAEAVVVATGGLACPATGSTGDGYRFAKSLGHHVTPLHPSLVPLVTAETWPGEAQGLSLKNAALTLFLKDKPVYQDFGELMFTHYGVSGPVILSASRHLAGAWGQAPRLALDLKPGLTPQTLDKRLLRDLALYGGKDFINSLEGLLPRSLIPPLVALSGIAPHKKARDLGRAERGALAGLLKNLTLTPRAPRGFAEAVVTCGGVCVREVNPSSMASKLVRGLYFAGEVLDVDGYTGGFNLQIAFSTGWLAGLGAAK
jgi:predicted Rossmann fold flavoprotein